ncbi:MAG: methylated-DNA--[protein]-cysteine S-methyltransferase [Clostridia bacterium]|jgi:methylated-DNA-[protein]-cysteine S-methyltransferase|nr:methylated-DNA--[protein]-cysteine S-methyltransferase [Clostridiales bacterium]
MGEKIIYQRFNTPIGPMLAAASGAGLCRLCLPGEESEEFFGWADKKYPKAVLEEGSSDVITAVEVQLGEYFAGKRKAFSVSLDLKGTVFQRRIWHILMQIPYGSTASYKDVAVAADSPAAVRAVGQANNRNPVPIIVPCHRVVGSGGKLVGYGGGLSIKRILLELEGIKVVKESIV